MTVEKIKALLDACYQAKRARELLPALPKGVTSSYIQYLDAIEQLSARACASRCPTSATRCICRAPA